MDKQRQLPVREPHGSPVYKLILKTIIFGLLLALAVFSLASCKAAAKPVGHDRKAKNISPSLRREVLADAKEDIAVIEGSKDDPAVLESAVAGKAMDTLKSQMEELKSSGLIKVREFENLKLKFGVYQKKVAGVTAEFVDNSRIIRIDNGQPQAVARAEKRKLYLGLAKVDGKWKIISILAGVNEGSGQ